MIEHYGDIIELDYKLKPDAIDQCKAIESWEWQEEKSRRYIDLIGDLAQEYRGKGEDDLSYNSNMDRLPEIRDFIALFTGVYKARVQQLDAGSYFEPHRDHFQGGKRFRILVPLNNTTRDKYAFFYEDRIIEFKPLTPYILNTRKVHGAMSFSSGTYHLLMSVNNTEANQMTALNMVTFR